MKSSAIKPFQLRNPHLKHLFTAFCALGCLAAAHNSSATLVSYQPDPIDLNDLDHHSVYTWRIGNINLQNQTITSASITFKNIANWDTNPNKLFLHLLDTAKGSGVRSFIDDPSGSTPVMDITDDFANPRFHNDPNWLVANGTADILLASPSFTMTPTTYTYTFTGAALTTLQAYIANGGNVAFGLDPDCHFFNDGITFNMNLTAVPEVASLGPIVGLIAVAAASELLRRRRRRSLAKI